MLRTLVINLLLMLGFLVVLELVFGTWFSDVHALHQFTKPRNLTIERPNPLTSGPPTVVYTRDKNGFRGLDGDVSKIDIVTVGGSTTDQRYLDESQTYQASLRELFAQNDRQLVIANAGIDGQSTFGHIQNFSSWFNAVDGLSTRYFLFYVGINDILILSGEEAYDSLEAESPRLRLQLFIREKSALYQLYLVLKTAYLMPNISHSYDKRNFAVGDDLVSTPMLPAEAFTSIEIQNSLSALTDRIEQLAELSRAMGAQPIFVTQRSAVWTREDGEVVGVSEMVPGFHQMLVDRFGTMNGVDMYNIERSVADAILAGCHSARADCFDLMAEIEFDLRVDFYDPVHTTSDGSQKIANYLYEKLKNIDTF